MKDVTLQRVVRDLGQIYEEVISNFMLNDVAVRITVEWNPISSTN